MNASSMFDRLPTFGMALDLHFIGTWGFVGWSLAGPLWLIPSSPSVGWPFMHWWFPSCSWRERNSFEKNAFFWGKSFQKVGG